MAKLIVLQIIAHLLADFVFQPGKWCRSKFESGFRSKYLYLHTLVVFLCAWIFSFSFRFVWLAFVIAACHFAVDGLKSIVERAIFAKNNPDKNVRLIPVFIADQLIHLGIIVLVSYLYVTIHTLSGFSDTFRLQTLWVIMGYLICLKPSNVLIQVVLRSYSLLPEDSSADNSDLERAGRLIGNLERILAFTLVLFGQYSAVGVHYCRQIHSSIQSRRCQKNGICAHRNAFEFQYCHFHRHIRSKKFFILSV